MANSDTNARTPASNVVSPVALLRDQVTRLDAAVLVCRAIPKKEPVHTLRKSTRYVEAQLALLQQIPGLPQHAAEADKVRRRLKSVRKAAGMVRDFDVQRKLVKDDAPAKNTAATTETTTTAKTTKDGSVDDRLRRRCQGALQTPETSAPAGDRQADAGIACRGEATGQGAPQARSRARGRRAAHRSLGSDGRQHRALVPAQYAACLREGQKRPGGQR